jgi:hypothetical protein
MLTCAPLLRTGIANAFSSSVSRALDVTGGIEGYEGGAEGKPEHGDTNYEVRVCVWEADCVLITLNAPPGPI